tara:strand:+ start:15 stop:1625 length:1611 start_codon:yes stop_codon:yes gene_type:complete
MASSYTANNGIEKIGTGEQAGTWGATTNTNFDILDRAINGVGAITLSGTTHTLTTTDGALSDGHFKVLVFGGTLSSTNTVTISPNDQDKLYFVFNNTSGDQSIIIKQGSGATVTVANGKTAIVYADGAGSGAAVAQIETGSDAFTEDLTVKTGDGALLTLQTSDTTVVDGDVLGALQFQAPNESSGTDAITVAASIVAEADDTFAADSNKTDLVFKLGQSEAATEKMRLTHEGDVELQNDLTLKSDASLIKFGADSEITLTHVADTGLTLTHTATGAGTPVVLNLKSEEDAIADGDVIGKITFTAGDDSGTDAIATAASIEAEADDTFAADSNKTDLVFKLGSSEAATEKMRLAHEGVLSIPADGSTTTNGIHIGAGADLKLYHESDTNIISSGTGNFPIRIQAHNNEQMAYFAVNGEAILYHDGSQKLATSSAGVSVTGALTASGDVTAFSDERLKSDIETIDNALNKVMNMRGVSYTKQAEKGIGVIAQEIEKVLPEVVTDGEYKSVAYGNIVGVLIEAIKEQQKQIDELKKDK